MSPTLRCSNKIVFCLCSKNISPHCSFTVDMAEVIPYRRQWLLCLEQHQC
jgi:hypothetical protein